MGRCRAPRKVQAGGRMWYEREDCMKSSAERGNSRVLGTKLRLYEWALKSGKSQLRKKEPLKMDRNENKGAALAQKCIPGPDVGKSLDVRLAKPRSIKGEQGRLALPSSCSHRPSIYQHRRAGLPSAPTALSGSPGQEGKGKARWTVWAPRDLTPVCSLASHLLCCSPPTSHTLP